MRGRGSQPTSLLRKRPLASAILASVVLSTAIAFAEGSEETPCGLSLACQNGGVCRQGNVSWPVGEDSNVDNLPSTTLTETNIESSYCECTSNSTTGQSFTGLNCEIPYQECEYAIGFAVCYHGGSCLDDPPTKWDGNTAVCNCETADHSGSKYVGRNCEVLSLTSDPCQGLESHCLNGGVCGKQNTATGSYCSCPPGFMGSRCESASRSTTGICDLECHHDGACQFASNEIQAPWGTLNDMFCECSKGYTGVQCEHFAEVCGDGSLCLHGSSCQLKENGSDYECRCAASSKYIGGVCVTSNDDDSVGDVQDQSSRVTHCSPLSSDEEFVYGMAIPSFCANGGTCREEVIDGLLLPACDCPKSFTGPHCEHVRSASDGQSPSNDSTRTGTSLDNESSKKSVVKIILWVMFAFCALWMARGGYRKYRAWKLHQESVVLNLQSFREENQGAVSANGSMLFPSARSQHRMATDGQFTMQELMHDVEIA